MLLTGPAGEGLAWFWADVVRNTGQENGRRQDSPCPFKASVFEQ